MPSSSEHRNVSIQRNCHKELIYSHILFLLLRTYTTFMTIISNLIYTLGKSFHNKYVYLASDIFGCFFKFLNKFSTRSKSVNLLKCVLAIRTSSFRLTLPSLFYSLCHSLSPRLDIASLSLTCPNFNRTYIKLN